MRVRTEGVEETTGHSISQVSVYGDSWMESCHGMFPTNDLFRKYVELCDSVILKLPMIVTHAARTPQA